VVPLGTTPVTCLCFRGWEAVKVFFASESDQPQRMGLSRAASR